MPKPTKIQTLYIHIPGLFVGTKEQHIDTFGHFDIETIVDEANETVFFAWLEDDQIEDFVKNAN